jgi:hypothetical protein
LHISRLAPRMTDLGAAVAAAYLFIKLRVQLACGIGKLLPPCP